jgi:hypothetical protein
MSPIQVLQNTIKSAVNLKSKECIRWGHVYEPVRVRWLMGVRPKWRFSAYIDDRWFTAHTLCEYAVPVAAVELYVRNRPSCRATEGKELKDREDSDTIHFEVM